LKERFDRLEEQLEIVTGLWRTPEGERFAHDGPNWVVSDSPARPAPVQPGGPPIIIGGVGAKRTPALVARFAAEYNVPFADVDTTSALQANIDRACATADRDPATVLRSAAQVVCCGADEAEVARRAARIGREPAELAENGLGGQPDALVEKLGRFAERGIERIYLQVLDMDDLEHLELIAAEVLPAATSMS
jgi:alkanesulfonate monooxygenase